jgi:hypothetical protein
VQYESSHPTSLYNCPLHAPGAIVIAARETFVFLPNNAKKTLSINKKERAISTRENGPT